MMMLLTGKPVTQESRAEATLLMGAISGLGGDSDSISTNIANFFRVDELAINSEKGIEQSELWIGKQLTPKLMVRYVVGLFDQLVSLGVQYQLSDRLRLEAESGETQSVDVIYRIER
jgi:translocation and assembly module TamB